MTTNPMDRAFNAGFAAGASGLSRSECPYKGHSAGYRRGMYNAWDDGYDTGTKYAKELREVSEDRDKAEDLLGNADNATVKGDWETAIPLLEEAAHRIRMVASACRYIAKNKPPKA